MTRPRNGRGSRRNPAIDKALEFLDQAEEQIKAAREQARLAPTQFLSGRFNVWKEIYRAKASLGRALEHLDDASPYSEMFYPTVQYDRMHDYSQPDGVARDPRDDDKPTKRRRHT